MKKIEINIPGNNYPIYIGKGSPLQLADCLEQHLKTEQIAIVSNDTVFKIYGKPIQERLSKKAEVIKLLVPDSEKSKSLHILEELYGGLLLNRFERKSTVIALGGGVVGDLAGYAAATYLRGINLVQVPTSLLAQVDSSIGGKTGINHSMGKNLIGAFKQPAFVFSDITVLKTLPASEIRCGMGEVIKYAFIGDYAFFEYLEMNIDKALAGDESILEHIVYISSRQKGHVVEKDEKESGLRMNLNYGHTFGHALEAEFGYGNLKHGEAIILGMKCALEFSHLKKELNNEHYTRGLALLEKVPIIYNKNNIHPEKLLERMYLDKKVADKNIRLVLVDKIGQCSVKTEIDTRLIKKAFEVLL